MKRKSNKPVNELIAGPMELTPPNIQTAALQRLSEAPAAFDGTLDGLARLVRVRDAEGVEGIAAARQRVVELLRGEEGMEKFVKTFDRLVRRHGVKGLEAPSLDLVAARSGTNRSACVGAIAKVLHQWNFDVAKLAVTAVCADYSVPVARSLAAAALDIENGHRDRRLFMEAARVIAQPGSGGAIQQVTVSAQANNTKVEAEQAVVVVGKELPSFEDGTKKMAAALRMIPPVEDE